MLADQFTLTGTQVLSTALAVVCLHLVWVLLLWVAGPRALLVSSAADFAVVAATGAVLGRTALLEHPTIATGAIALATFALVHAASVALRHVPRLAFPARRPLVLVQDGRLLPENLRAGRVREDDIRQAIRSAGATSLDDAHCVVLEANGGLSVIRGTGPLDPWVGADLHQAAAPQ